MYSLFPTVSFNYTFADCSDQTVIDISFDPKFPDNIPYFIYLNSSLYLALRAIYKWICSCTNPSRHSMLQSILLNPLLAFTVSIPTIISYIEYFNIVVPSNLKKWCFIIASILGIGQCLIDIYKFFCGLPIFCKNLAKCVILVINCTCQCCKYCYKCCCCCCCKDHTLSHYVTYDQTFMSDDNQLNEPNQNTESL